MTEPGPTEWAAPATGVGPWAGDPPDDPRYDPILLRDGDTRNVVDAYRYWTREAIIADIDSRRHPLHIAIENFGHDANIGSVVRTANAFAVDTVHIVGRRRWNRRGAMVTDRYQRLCHHDSTAELLGFAATLLRDGYSPDLTALYGEPAGPLQRLPAYVFEHTSRFWSDGPMAYLQQPTPAGRGESTAPAAERADGQPAHDRTEGNVLALIADVGNYPVTALTRSKRLADDLGYDSLLQLRLLDRLRKDYPQLQHVRVGDLQPRIQSVGDLVDFVMDRLDRSA